MEKLKGETPIQQIKIIKEEFLKDFPSIRDSVKNIHLEHIIMSTCLEAYYKGYSQGMNDLSESFLKS